MLFRHLLLIFFLFISVRAICQPQDVDFHLNAHLLNGKKILKVKRDFYDSYLWVLAQNNQVFRVNSLTLAVDDYTPIFAPYNNLQFIDIAGRSKDTVFIASNPGSLIHYANGTIKVIGSADGLNGTINSIGIKGGVPNIRQSTANLFIGSNEQLYTYNSDSDQLSAPGYPGSSLIYQATYRANFFSDSTENYFSPINPDTVLFKPVTYLQSPSVIIDGWVAEGGTEVGTDITTADFTFSGNSNSDFTAFFYGDSKGMSQCAGAGLNIVDGYVPIGHYLNGIRVNKIADIYGLLSLGSNLAHQHLLVGTDNGFYFSSNIFSKNESIFRDFSLFYDQDVGNVRINDISVNALSTDNPICENAVWLAADDGLYLLKPDYGAYLNSQQLQAASFVNQLDTLSTINICQGDTIAAMVNKYQYPGNSIQWYKNGLELPAQSSDTLAISTTGAYYAVLYDPCENIHIQSNTLNANVISSPIFTFNYPDKIQQCNNNPNTLRLTNNPGYHYRWYTNGTLNGDTTNSFTVTQSGKYKVEVSACSNSWVPSKEVEVDMITLPVPMVTADKAVYCAEDVATLSVNTPVDASYTINWYQDGNLLGAKKDSVSIKETQPGNYTVTISSNIANCTQTSAPLLLSFTPAPVFLFDYPDQLQICSGTPLRLFAIGSGNYQYRWYKDDVLTNVTVSGLDVTENGKYKIEVSSCAGSWVASKEVQVQFVTLGVPVVSFGKAGYCTGDVAVVSENFPPDPSYTIDWYYDNLAIGGVTNELSFTTYAPGDYKAVLVYKTQNSDGSFCQQISESKSLVFNAPPMVSIQQTVNTTLCAGQTVTLTAQHSTGTAQWSTGETSDQITVIQTGTYKVTITSPGGCQADTSIKVAFLPGPVLSLRDTSVCTFKKQSITLTAPAGFAAYNWNNGASTSETYPVTRPQTVSLTVTDANGCQATQQIKVADECPALFIPNTFTPNGDGINDTWVIEGLDEAGTVKVFTRWGAEVYQSVGYSSPWNGEYSGKKLAPGVYYYIITAKNGTQKFSGSLTIIY